MTVESFIRNRSTHYTRTINGHKYALYFDDASSELFLSTKKKKTPFLPFYYSVQDEPVPLCFIGKHYDSGKFFYKSDHGTISAVGPDFLPILLLADLLRVTDVHTAFDIMKDLRHD